MTKTAEVGLCPTILDEHGFVAPPPYAAAAYHIDDLLMDHCFGVTHKPLYRAAIQRITERLLEQLPSVSGGTDGFSLLRTLQGRGGQFIEVGGPTPDGYSLIDFREVHEATGKKVSVTTLTRQRTNRLPSLVDQSVVDIGPPLDARDMRLPLGSAGALIAAHLFPDVRLALFDSALDVLEDDGVVVYRGAQSVDVAFALHIGLRLQQYKRKSGAWEVVLQK